MAEVSLLPPNSTRLELELEAVDADRMAAIDTAIRTLWNPAECPEAFLPFLAWQFSVDKWNPEWPVAVKRAVIAASIPAHKIKGTRGAVEDVVAAFGSATIDITEWWETAPAGTPGTFELNMVATDANGDPVSAAMQQDIVDSITAVKRLSQHFSLVIGQSVASAMKISPIVSVAQYVRLGVNLMTEVLRPVAGYAASIAASNPYQWLKMDEAVGPTASDSSGNTRDGTYEEYGGDAVDLNQPEFPVGTVDLSEVSVLFHGGEEYLDTGILSSLCDDDFTADVFFNPSLLTPVDGAMMDKTIWHSFSPAPISNAQIVIGIDEGVIALSVTDENGVSDIARGSTAITAGSFFLARTIHDSSEKTIRVLVSRYPEWNVFTEEIQYSYASLAPGSLSSTVILGYSAAYGSESFPQAFSGYMSNWIFWDRILADTEAVAQYENE